MLQQWNQVRSVPAMPRALVGCAVGALSTAGVLNQRFARLGERLGARGIGQYYEGALANFRDAELDALVGHSPRTRIDADTYPGEDGEKLCLWDLHHYMPGDILTKVDRATMAVSIEGREPLIDHRLVEFAVSLPFQLRRGALGPKHLLKKILYRHVPREMVERPKRGFAVPVKQWLTGDLKSLVNDHLNPRRIASQGLFDPQRVEHYLGRLRSGDVSVRQRVWLLLAFQMWHARWMERA